MAYFEGRFGVLTQFRPVDTAGSSLGESESLGEVQDEDKRAGERFAEP
jgi:hypothetical protein